MPSPSKKGNKGKKAKKIPSRRAALTKSFGPPAEDFEEAGKRARKRMELVEKAEEMAEEEE